MQKKRIFKPVATGNTMSSRVINLYHSLITYKTRIYNQPFPTHFNFHPYHLPPFRKP